MSIFQKRSAKIQDILGDTTAAENGFQIPEKPGRYLVVLEEEDSPVWAYSINSFKSAKTRVNEDVTENITSVTLFDLDTSKKYDGYYQVVDWMEF